MIYTIKDLESAMDVLVQVRRSYEINGEDSVSFAINEALAATQELVDQMKKHQKPTQRLGVES